MGLGNVIKEGDIRTKLSFLIMGFGNLTRGQIFKGLSYLLIQITYIMYVVDFGWDYLKLLNTLGISAKKEVWDAEEEIYRYIAGDNSMLILLFSVVTIGITVAFLVVYIKNVQSAYKAQKLVEKNKKLPKLLDELSALLNERYHMTLLAVPTLLVIVFTVLPVVFMILIAFTNFDQMHQPPGNLFTWIGFQNFKDMMWQDPLKSSTFFSILGWTLVWAFFATFLNYILGMLLALAINKEGVRFKRFWRTIFVTTAAVPQFVSLMLMSQILHELGPINVLLQEWGWVESAVPFLTDGDMARITVIVVNIWVGIPYTMLITTGILMNIPKELYESAKIDGANPVQMFGNITLPYMLFVTTPYLITQFIGNINNFNVIYLLTRGRPLSLDYFQAGKTDLLVTWLYKLTVEEANYGVASTIGIFVFILSSTLSLVVFNITASRKREGDFM